MSVPQQDLFDVFWRAYPRRVAKADARKAWARLRPDEHLLALMLAALHWQKEQPDWLKDDGQYVPYPATWLRGERWEDEPPSPTRVLPGKESSVAYSLRTLDTAFDAMQGVINGADPRQPGAEKGRARAAGECDESQSGTGYLRRVR